MYTYQWPVRTHFGAGLIKKIGDLVPPSTDRHQALVTSAADTWCRPLIESVREQLLHSGWQTVAIWSEIEPNPSRDTVDKGTAFCTTSAADTIFAIGGGSTLDGSKMIAWQAGVDHLIAVPTTAGTGSELNEWAVITNTQTSYKESLQTVMPSVALLDPELTFSVPPMTTLLTGIDAFSHALECYVAATANAVTDAVSLMAMELVARWLRRAVEYGDGLAARTAMLEASMLAGGAMLGVEGLGLMHGIGNVTGGFTHDDHGLILARLLDAVVDFNAPAIPEEKRNRMVPFVDTVRQLALEKFEQNNVPEVTLRESDLALMAERAAINPNSRGNPRQCTETDIIAIARKSYRIIAQE